MSVIDLSTLTERELIFHYVLSCKNQGLSLPYSDLAIIDTWLSEIQQDADALLMILSDILPAYFEKRSGKANLKSLQNSVSKKIREHLFSQPTQTL